MSHSSDALTPALATLRLQAELDALRQSLLQSAQDSDVVELDQSSMGRVSRNDALQQQAMAMQMRARMQQRERKIEAALARVNAGSYGLCCECQEPIEPNRFNTDLASVFCTDCAGQR